MKPLRKLTETCGNEEGVSVLLKLYRNLLHQVSVDWNFAETFSLFPHCWNWTETYTSGFHWRKLDGIQLKLYYRFYIAETKLETSTLSFYLVSAVFQFCWNGIVHPVTLNVLWLLIIAGVLTHWDRPLLFLLFW